MVEEAAGVVEVTGDGGGADDGVEEKGRSEEGVGSEVALDLLEMCEGGAADE